MNTRQLRHFLAVMDLGTLSAAAEAVHLSQPALSRSLRALEDELRAPLFDRQDRRLRPTPYALEYADRARRMVFEEKEGARALALMRAGELGPLAFGMGSSIATTLLGPMVLQLLAAAPGLRVTALVQNSDVLLAELRAERLDFFIGNPRVVAHDPDLTVESVYRCGSGWYARDGHPLAGRRGITIDELSAFPLIGGGYADEAIARRMAQLYGWSLPLTDHFAVSTNDATAARALITSSDAILPATDVAVASLVRSGAAVRLDARPALDVEVTFAIVERAGRTRAPAVERAFQIIRAHFGAVAQEAKRPRAIKGRATKPLRQ
jgi:DNA-binding transcriptional LysR family regulator